MIVYDKLWTTLKEKNISQYTLINKYHVSAGQLSRLRTNANVSTHTLDMLCSILDCELSDIAEYRKELVLMTLKARISGLFYFLHFLRFYQNFPEFYNFPPSFLFTAVSPKDDTFLCLILCALCTVHPLASALPHKKNLKKSDIIQANNKNGGEKR